MSDIFKRILSPFKANRYLTSFEGQGVLLRLLCVYIFLLPLMHMPSLGRLGNKIQYADLVFCLIFFIFIFKLLPKLIGVNFKKIIFPLLILLASISLSVLNSPDKYASAIEIIGIAYLALLFFVCLNIVRNDKQADLVLKTFAFSAYIVCFLGILGQILWFLIGNNFLVEYIPSYSLIKFPRISSTFLIPNMLASYLHVSFIINTVLYFRAKNPGQQKFYFAAGILIALVAFLTYSRILLGIVFSLFLILMKLKTNPKVLITRLCCGCLLLALSIYVILSTAWIKPFDFSTPGGIAKKPLSIYLLLNKSALRMFKEHPILGVGAGMFNKELVKTLDWQEVSVSYMSKGIKDTKVEFDPHSTFLGWAAETGSIGLFGILFFFGTYAVFLKDKLLRIREDNRQYLVNWAFYCGFLGFLINGLYLDILTLRHFWLMLALGLAV